METNEANYFRSAQILGNHSAALAQYLQYLHNIYTTISTQYLHNIYTISTQYLHRQHDLLVPAGAALGGV